MEQQNRPAFVDVSQHDLSGVSPSRPGVKTGVTRVDELGSMNIGYIYDPSHNPPHWGMVRFAVDVSGIMHLFKANYDTTD